MKRVFSEEQIIELIEQNQAGTDVIQLCKDNNVGVSTFYRWKAKYKGMNSHALAGIRHLQEEKIKELEAEIGKLKKALEQAETDVINLKDLIAKKLIEPGAKRDAVQYLRSQYGYSERQACQIIQCNRKTARRVLKRAIKD